MNITEEVIRIELVDAARVTGRGHEVVAQQPMYETCVPAAVYVDLNMIDWSLEVLVGRDQVLPGGSGFRPNHFRAMGYLESPLRLTTCPAGSAILVRALRIGGQEKVAPLAVSLLVLKADQQIPASEFGVDRERNLLDSARAFLVERERKVLAGDRWGDFNSTPDRVSAAWDAVTESLAELGDDADADAVRDFVAGRWPRALLAIKMISRPTTASAAQQSPKLWSTLLGRAIESRPAWLPPPAWAAVCTSFVDMLPEQPSVRDVQRLEHELGAAKAVVEVLRDIQSEGEFDVAAALDTMRQAQPASPPVHNCPRCRARDEVEAWARRTAAVQIICEDVEEL